MANSNLLRNRTGVPDDARSERAQRAVKTFKAMQFSLTSFARGVTGNPKISVVMQAGPPMTDGTKIYYQPPIALGDPTEHERRLCEKRDNNKVLRCPACAIREDVMVDIFHEIAHIAFGSNKDVTDTDRRTAVEKAIEEWGGKYAEQIKKRMEYDRPATRSYMGLSGLISPFLPMLLNALEDVRVDSSMFKARAGVRTMMEADYHQMFTDGSENWNEEFVKWSDAPLNAQVVIGCYMVGCGFNAWRGQLAPVVEQALEDEQLNKLLVKVAESSDATAVYNLSFKVLARLRELGFLRRPEDEEQDEDSDERRRDEEGDPKDPKHGSDGSLEDEDSTESSDQASKESGEGADSGDQEDRDDRSGDGVPESANEGSGQPPEPDDSGGSTDGEPENEEGEVDGTDQDEVPESDGGSNDRSPDEGSEATGDTPGDTRERGDSGDDGSSGSSEGGEEGDGGRGDHEQQGDHDDSLGDAGGDPSPEEASGGESGSGTESDNSSDDRNQGVEGSESSGSNQNPDGQDESGDSPSGSEGSVSGEGEFWPGGEDPGFEDQESAAKPSPGQVDRIDTGADDGSGGLGVDQANYGDPGEVKSLLEQFHKEDVVVDPSAKESKADDKAMSVAIVQGLYFETPSTKVAGVREHIFDSPLTHNGKRLDQGWAHDRYRGMFSSFPEREYRYQIGIDVDLDVPESVLGQALLATRRVFTDNATAHHQRNLKTGRINKRVLGRRAWNDDPRLFTKKRLPGKRSYAVLLGIDISGSTLGENIALAKRSAWAQAELCNRVGVDFAIYAHSASNRDGSSGRSNSLYLDIYQIKGFDEPWDPSVQLRLRELGSDSENLDGHSLEYYRKQLDKIDATDKVCLYYSDGKMPAANYDEELEILQREIRVFAQKKYTLLGVGIRTDSPRQHGLDTVEVHSDEDLKAVISHLDKVLVRTR